MEILSIEIERSNQQSHFCGTLSYRAEDLSKGHLLWTVECESEAKINVIFVQGSDDHWVKTAETHAYDFSDNIILMIAKNQPMPSLTSNLSHFI